VAQPFLVFVVLEDPGVQVARFLVGDAVEVDPVEIPERGELIPVEARGPDVVEVVLPLGPPLVERAARLPRRDGVVPGEIAVPPQARESRPAASVSTPGACRAAEVVVGVDRGDGSAP
jgi:hypothetical protein